MSINFLCGGIFPSEDEFRIRPGRILPPHEFRKRSLSASRSVLEATLKAQTARIYTKTMVTLTVDNLKATYGEFLRPSTANAIADKETSRQL
ncbi:hypothetical protein BDW72DRAFT_177089 [Aspergillus terricola var. indicus]